MSAMDKLFYDLHMHSCLSPCGDNDMTVQNMIGMAKLKELDVVALTDHNSCKNCDAFLKVAKSKNIIAIPGMELCTSEEIHMVCLFEKLENALDFDEYVYSRIPSIKNVSEVYGNQYIIDEKDIVVAEEEKLLITAADISIEKLPGLMKEFDGICFPAHIDRDSYSILSVFGVFPSELSFAAAEIYKPQLTEKLERQHPALKNMNILHNSDAHYLWDISERYNSIEVDSATVKNILEKIVGSR